MNYNCPSCNRELPEGRSCPACWTGGAVCGGLLALIIMAGLIVLAMR